MKLEVNNLCDGIHIIVVKKCKELRNEVNFVIALATTDTAHNSNYFKCRKCLSQEVNNKTVGVTVF